MHLASAHFALLTAFACAVESYIHIPERLRNGKMNQYPACRALFNQTSESYAVVKENLHGPYGLVCNCSFSRNPPQSGLSIRCEQTREISIPLTSYHHLTDVAYFIIRYRRKDSSTPWQVERVEFSRDSPPVAKVDLNFKNGVSYIYTVQVFGVLRDNSRLLLHTDEISSATGTSVISGRSPIYPTELTEYRRQTTLNFNMVFNEITDDTIEVFFETDNRESFRVDYIQNGRQMHLLLDDSGRATLSGLQPETQYTFIVSYLQGGEWKELKRHNVETLPEQRIVIQSTNRPAATSRRVTILECPIAEDLEVDTISWYRVEDGESQLIATYVKESGETTYPPGGDPNFEVREGRILAIKNVGSEYAGIYRCRISVLGEQYLQWPTVRIAQRVRAQVTWRPVSGITTYYIRYRPEADVRGLWRSIVVDSSQSTAIIGNLQPLTTYVFQVFNYTGNTRGRLVDSMTVKTTASGRQEMSFCLSEPCLNHGVCKEIPSGYQCLCRGGFSGRNCERARTPCNPNPCENEGVCRSKIDGGYTCTCRSGYTGLLCRTAVRRNPCDSNPCSHGRCFILGVNYNCECGKHYHGRNCDLSDSGPSFLLQCPVKEEYGTPNVIRWYRIQGQRYLQIYTFDISSEIRNVDNSRYVGRLSSPSHTDLIIHNADASDVGTYQCSVSYQFHQETSKMQLFKVPANETRIAISWTQSPLYIDHYKVIYRNIRRNDESTVEQVPPDSTRYTLHNLEPNGAYEIHVIPYTRSGDAAQPLPIQYISPNSPTTTMAVTTTTRSPPSRGDSREKPIGYIDVNVEPVRSGPYSVGSRVVLECVFETLNGSLSIIWRKDGSKIISLSPSNRINVRNGGLILLIKQFEESDEGTYTCDVEYDLPTSMRVGEGSLVVTAVKQIPPPQNLQVNVTGSRTAILTWQSPGRYAITGYNVIYHPTTQTYSKQHRQVSIPTIKLTNLREGNEYQVQIVAISGHRLSAPLEQQFTQQMEIVPAPSHFRRTMLSDTEAIISWDQQDLSGITSYKIQYWDVTRSASPPNLVTKETTSKNVILSNLVNGKTYQVILQAKKGDKLSAPLSRQFKVALKPNPPATVSFKDVGNDTVTVSWTAPTGWTPDTKYRVRVHSRDEENPYSYTYPDSAPNTRTVKSLSPGVRYYVTIQSVVDGVLSNPLYGAVKTDDVVKLSAPYPDLVTLECKTQTTSYIYQVQWFKSNPSGQESLIYIAYPGSSGTRSRQISGTQFFGRLSAPTLTVLQVSNISYPDDFGKYKCKAYSSGRKDSAVINVVTQYPARIEPPYDFKYTQLNSTAARISWEHPYGEDISAYTITYRADVPYLASEKSLEVEGNSVVLDELIPGIEYTVIVKSKVLDKESDEPLVGAFVNAGNQVTNVQVTRLPDRNELQITWDNPEGSEGILLAVKHSDDDHWDEQPAAFGNTSSQRIYYPLNPGKSIQVKISSVRNDVATPTIVTYTEPGSPVTQHNERVPDFPLDVLEPRPTVAIRIPASVMNLRLESGTPERLSISFDDTPVEEYDYYRIKVTNTRTGQFENFNTTQPYLEVLLSPGQTYEVSVSTVLDGIFSPPLTKTITLSPELEPTPPMFEPVSAPNNLRFSSIMRSRFTVSWDSDDAGVTGFQVKYRPYGADEEWKTIGTTNYQVTVRGVHEDTEYIVQVVASNEQGTSEPVEDRVKTKIGGRVNLRRPKVRVISRSNNSFSLRFGDSTTAYRVETVLVGAEDNVLTTSVERGEDSVQVNGLEAGKHYRVSVSRVANGRVGKATRFRATTNPNQPVNVAVSEIQPNSLTLIWDEPESDEITGYRVIYTPASTNIIQSVDTTTNTAHLINLEPNTQYDVRVQSKQGNEISFPTELSVTTTADIQPVEEISFTDISENSAIAEWIPPDTETSYSYEVKLRPAEDLDGWLPTKTTQQNWELFEGLNPATEYIVEVTSRLGDKRSEPISTTLTTGSIVNPDNINFDVNEGVMELSWDDVNADEYEVKYHHVGDDRHPIINLVRTPHYNITNIEPGEYEVTVTAIKSGHRSDSTTTVQSIGVKPPQKVGFSDTTENGFVIMWEPSDTSGVVNYVVRVKPVDDLEGDFEEVLTEENFMTITDLEPGTTYTVQVMASTPNQDSEPITATVSTGVASPELVTTTLGEDDGSVSVNWLPVPDAFSYQVTYYPVGTSDSMVVIVDGSENQAILHDLQQDTEYVIEVTSLINDIESEPVKNRVTTPLAKPKSVEVAKDDSESSSSVEITWDDQDAAPVYEIRYYPVHETGSDVRYGEPHSVFVPGRTGGIILSDLIPATKYVVEIVASDGRKSSKPERVTVTTSLDQPEILEDKSGEDQVMLRWKPSNGTVTGYRVDLIPSDGSATISTPVDGTKNSITVTGLQPGTEYEVRVTAMNTDLNVESTSVVSSVETKPADVKPVNTIIRKLPNDSYVITWARPSSRVSYYLIHYRATDGTPSENTIKVLPDETNVVLPQLVPNTEYQIHVQGVLNNGDVMTEHNTIERNFTTDVPTMPDHIRISGVSDDHAELEWESPANERYLSGYRVEFFPTGSRVLTNAVEVPRSSNTASTRGLEPNTNYTVRVTPHINFRPGRPASTTFVTDRARVVPSPNSVEVQQRNTDNVVIQWENPTQHDVITSYEVLVEQESGEVFSYEIDASQNRFTISDLSPGTSYNVTLTPFVGDRHGQPVTTSLTTLPQSPQQVVINNVQTNDLVVEWRPDENADTYIVSVYPLDNPSAETITYDTEETRVLVTDLLPGTTYTVEVTAVTPNGEESEATRLEIITLPETKEPIPEAPVKPEGSITFTPQQQDILISWESLKDVPVDAYQIFYTAPGEPIRTVTVPNFVKEGILSSLKPEKEYDVWVVGVLPFGENAPVLGSSQHTVTIIPPDNYEPLTNEPVIAPDDGKISVTWEPLGDDVTVYGVNYTNLVTGENYQTVVPGTFPGTLLTGLNPGDDYAIEVVAVENGIPIQLDHVNIGTSDFVVDENSIQATSPSGRFHLQWFQDSQDDDRIIGYTVIYERKCCLGEPDMMWVPAPNRSTILNLEPNTEYVFTVEGKTFDGVEIPIPDVIGQSIPAIEVQTRPDNPPTDHPIVTNPGPNPVTIPSTRSQPVGSTEKPVLTTVSSTLATTERIIEPIPTLPGQGVTERTFLVASRTSPAIVTHSRPFSDPLGNTETMQSTRRTAWPTTTTSSRRTSTLPVSTTTPTQQETPELGALPTSDGNIIVSWTATEEPEEYILEYYPKDGSSPTRTITMPGDVSWASLPEPTNQNGYVITIYTVKDGVTQPIYDVELGRSPTTGGFVLSYKPAGDQYTSLSQPITTQEVLIPTGEESRTLSDSEYVLTPTDDEYTRWLSPILPPTGSSGRVMLRWNPDQTNITETIERLRLELVPINNTNARTITRYLPSHGMGTIPGLLPGVSYRLYARYLQNSHAGDIATQFVIPAFTSQGTRITQQRFGSTDVWMNELRSGNLLLQWQNYPGATSYRVENRELPDGRLNTTDHGINNRWIVLPQLRAGGVYSINIYATVDGQLIKIYTVTVRRKISAPQPPSKIEWYNMYGDRVDLAWIPPATAITGYRITYKLDEEFATEFVANLTADARTFHMSNLQPGKRYRITIQTLRGEQISRAFSFVIQMNIPTVRRLFFRQIGPDTILVNWPALPDYVTGYMIRVKQSSPEGPDLVPADILDPEVTEYTIEGIKASYRYEFIIRTLVDDAESDPVTLQLWTLRQESQVSRIEETGRWTVTWSGEPYDIDHWKMEVRRRGSQTILQVLDNIDRSTTSVDLDDLPLGIEYIVSIYGVKDGSVSAPIQVVIPAEAPSGRPSIPGTGQQLVERISIQKRADSIRILLYPVIAIDRYDIQYKVQGMPDYISGNVTVAFGADHDTATITNLLPDQFYDVMVTAIKGDDQSTMVVQIATAKQPLRALQHITSSTVRFSNRVLLRWDRPDVTVAYYEVTYLEAGQSVTRRVRQPMINVPIPSQGGYATFRLRYVTHDNRRSPDSIVKLSYSANTRELPAPGGISSFEEESEQP